MNVHDLEAFGGRQQPLNLLKSCRHCARQGIHKRNTPGLLTRLTKARAAGNIEIYDALHRIAKAGSVPALIWLSRTRLGQGKDIPLLASNGATIPGTAVSTEGMEEKLEFCRQLREAIFAPDPEPPPTKPANAHEVPLTVEPPPINPLSKN